MDAKDTSPSKLAEDVAAAIPKDLQEAFARVVKAGMKVMFSDQTHDVMLDELEQEGDFAERVGSAMADLMTFLYIKSNKSMPPEVIFPAATYLLAEGADFMEKVTGEQVTPDILATAMDVMVRKILNRFGLDEAKYAQAIEQAAATVTQQGGA